MAAIAQLAGLSSYSGRAVRPNLSPLLRFVETSSAYRIEESNSGLEILLNESLSASFPEQAGDTLLAAGSAIFMLRLAMRCHGMRPRVEFKLGCAKSTVLAKVLPIGTIEPSEEDLAMLLGSAGQQSPLGSQQLVEAVSQEGARFRIVSPSSIPARPSAELLGVVCTGYDDLTGWLIAGQAVRHAQLLGERNGWAVSLLSGQEIDGGFRARFARESGFRDFPHAVLSCVKKACAA